MAGNNSDHTFMPNTKPSKKVFWIVCVSLLAVSFLAVSCSTNTLHSKSTYIPTDLDDAHRELQRLLTAKEIQHIKTMHSQSGMIEYHMGLGLWLRNNWGLWHESRLARYFDQLGIYHADDMSGLILETFWCKLHDQPFKIEDRASESQEYWKSMEKPKGGSPKDGARIAWVITKGSGKGTVHLGMSISDRSYWR